MPEGDTIHRAAKTLDRVLRGQRITRFESVLPALVRVDEDAPLAGRTIESVTAHGKHLLIAFSGDLVLHTHMRMNGTWHIYPVGARWRRPRREMRIVIETARASAVGFNVPVAEFLNRREFRRHRELAALGPDPLAESFDADEARRRLRERGRGAIGDVLLDQRAIAGIGNVLKSETLFLAGINPFVPVADLASAHLDRIVDIARRLLAVNVADERRALHAGGGRRTTNRMNPHEKLWVYGRGGQPCRRCGTPIEARKTGADARLTYWCPACQPRGSDRA